MSVYYYISDGAITEPPERFIWADGREVRALTFPRPYQVGPVSLGADATDADLAALGVYRLAVTERGDPPGLDSIPTSGALTVDAETGTVQRTDGWRLMDSEEYAEALAALKAEASGAIPRDPRVEALALKAVAESATDPVLVLVDGALEEMTPAEAIAHADGLLLAAYQADLIRWGRTIAAETAETLEDAEGANHEPTVWVQPEGAHDAYSSGALVLHGGNLWQSTTPANVWEPGVSGWRNLTVAAGAGYPAWVQPTGGHDAYHLGDRVSHDGKNWESTIDANVWEPGVHGWVEI
jgi:hypothetical protein